MSVPHLSASKLLRLLRKHGYEVVPTKKGWIVINPRNGMRTSFHESTLSNNKRDYLNVVRDLRKIGFDLKDVR